MEGLYEAFAAGFLNDTVANLTQQYISVQYNAVQDKAGFNVSGYDHQVYGPSWNGSGRDLPASYDQSGQIAASELFVTALGVGPPKLASR